MKALQHSPLNITRAFIQRVMEFSTFSSRRAALGVSAKHKHKPDEDRKPENANVKLSDAEDMCPFLRRIGGVANALHATPSVEAVRDLAEQCPMLQNVPARVTLLDDIGISEMEEEKPLGQQLLEETYESKFTSHIDKLKAEGRYRYFANLQRHRGNFPNATLRPSAELSPEEREKLPPEIHVKIFCSNDYLGMGQHPKVIQASHEALEACGTGAGGTRNIAGTTKYHVELEKELAEIHQKERALLFSSCFVANEAALSAIGQLLPDAVMVSDEANHASMIAGIRHSKLEKRIYRHNDMEHLEEILASLPLHRPKIIVFESVYSMSGGICPMQTVVNIARRYNAMTFCDEVHAVGMYGNSGAGVADRDNLLKEIDVYSGTLGKAFGVYGGYIAGSKDFVDAVRSSAAGFIFTTAIPPVVAAGALASVRHLRYSSNERSLQQLRARQLKDKLIDRHIPIMPNPSHIVPVLVRDAGKCKALTDKLLYKYGFYLQPINYPTVKRGSERLRITPGPLHSETDLENLADAISELWDELELPREATKLEGVEKF